MVLERQGDAPGESLSPPKALDMPPELQDFLRELNVSLPEGRLLSFGSSVYLVPPETPDLRGLRVLRPGLELGVLKKGRFEPAHALALWLRTCARTADFPPESPEISAYLRGESLPGDGKGWTLITAGGVSLGWAKASGGQLKNHYPKGLRRMGS